MTFKLNDVQNFLKQELKIVWVDRLVLKDNQYRQAQENDFEKFKPVSIPAKINGAVNNVRILVDDKNLVLFVKNGEYTKVEDFSKKWRVFNNKSATAEIGANI